MTDVIGKKGGKGGGGGSSTGAKEAPNTLQSSATARVLEIISHGECVGLADETNILRSIYLDNTPVQNPDGSNNFEGIEVSERFGLPSQEPFTGFSEIESETGLAQDIEVATPRTYTVTNNYVDAVRMTIQFAGLVEQDTTTGDLNGSSVSFKFERRIGAGSWELVLTEQITDKCTSPQQLSYRIERPPAATDTDDWSVRVTRLTPDPATSAVHNEISLVSATEITDSNLMYSGLAGVGLTIDSKQFGSRVPVRSYDYVGLILDIPSNYTPPDPLDPVNPAHRTYSGLWDGTFKRGWCDNPAWVLWALLTDKDYGLGKLISPDQVDKWSLYQIAQYCDEFVEDGYGGEEPRFRVNTQITGAEESFALLQSIASAFRGMMYWSSGSVAFIADQPRDAVKLMSPANVLQGEFTYSGAARKARHSVAQVTWNDPSDNYEPAVEVVEDAEMIMQFGYRPTKVVAFGCITKGQAHRYGKWILDTEKYESETVTFQVSYENMDLRPGNIIEIYDPAYSSARYAGRFIGIGEDQGGLDSPVLLETGKTYVIHMVRGDGSIVEREITTTPDDLTHSLVQWTPTLYDFPAVGTDALIFSESLVGELQRGVIDTIASGTATFITSIVMNANSTYQATFTQPDGTVVVRTITTTITSGTQLGTSDDYEHLTITWSGGSTGAVAGSVVFIAPPDEGYYLREVANTATAEGVIVNANVPFDSSYEYFVTLTRGDGTQVTRRLINPGAPTTSLTWEGDICPIPVMGGMWGIVVSDLAPRKFQVINIAEAEKGIFAITALLHDPDKYDRIETGVELPPVEDTEFTLDTPPDAPTDIVASRFPTLQEDGTFIDYIQVMWTASESPFVSKYRVMYQHNGGAWEVLPDVTSNNIKFLSAGPGEYAFKVQAISMNSLESVPALAGWTLVNDRPYDGAVISNIHVENDAGATVVGDTIKFTSPDLNIAWDVLPPPNWPDQSITNWEDPYLLYYLVRFISEDESTEYGTWQATERRFTLTRAQNILSAGGTAVRNFKIAVSMVDAYGSYDEEIQEFLNEAPDTPTGIVLAATTRGFTISCDFPSEIDVSGSLVWVSTSNGFDPLVVTPTFDGPQTNFSMNATTGTTYYVRVAHYDFYSKDPADLNISGQSSITVGTLTSGDIDPSAVVQTLIAPASESLVAGNLVNVWNDSGTAKVRKANATAEGKEAHGYILDNYSTTDSVTVYLEGTNTDVSGLTIGTQFLSTTGGASTTTAPTGSGNVVQRVGFAKSSTTLSFEPGDPVTRA